MAFAKFISFVVGSYFISNWESDSLWSWCGFRSHGSASWRKEASYGRCVLPSMASSWGWSGYSAFLKEKLIKSGYSAVDCIFLSSVQILLHGSERANITWVPAFQFGIFGICDGHGGAEAARSASMLVISLQFKSTMWLPDTLVVTV